MEAPSRATRARGDVRGGATAGPAPGAGRAPAGSQLLVPTATARPPVLAGLPVGLRVPVALPSVAACSPLLRAVLSVLSVSPCPPLSPSLAALPSSPSLRAGGSPELRCPRLEDLSLRPWKSPLRPALSPESPRSQGPGQWGPLKPLMEATLPGHRTMNPCPVWEQKSGHVYLFFICVQGHVTEREQIVSGRNAARLCFICSQDAGCSWSEVRDLTEEVIGSEVKHWATFAVGPGHGIQLQSGRLVIPAYAYYIPHWFHCFRLPCKTRPHSLMIYSDDLGSTWHHGSFIRPMVTVECQVAEVTRKDGQTVLYCSARTPNRCRAEALSTDHGECFQRQVLSPQLCEPPHGCQGSVVSFRSPEISHRSQIPSGKGTPTIQKSPLLDSSLRLKEEAGQLAESWLLYSHPTSKKRRVNLGIYLNQNPLDTACWSQPWILHCGPCGYSDLAVLEEEGLLACLFECGIKRECEQIAFRLFTDREILSHMQGDYTSPDREPELIQD
uniref:exo-alpha-sialidase n=1 Tax=Oryctolagus cuniculus TaxID=9986 RepID=G1TIS3_RABIT